MNILLKLKENNFKIIFRPHPHVYEFIDLFDENEYVKIDYDKKLSIFPCYLQKNNLTL